MSWHPASEFLKIEPKKKLLELLEVAALHSNCAPQNHYNCDFELHCASLLISEKQAAMASDKPEKKEKKDKKERKEKKHRASESDGVTKSKSDKKEKKDKKKKTKEAAEALLDQAESSPVVVPTANGDSESGVEDNAMEGVELTRNVPTEALVPFANPLADDKQTKKLLKAVKKCMIPTRPQRFLLS
jgi:hypothetical protein